MPEREDLLLLRLLPRHGPSPPDGVLAQMSNTAFLQLLGRGSIPETTSEVRLAYLDPPFMSGKDRSAPFLAPPSWRAAGVPRRPAGIAVYSDRWASMEDYLAFLERRLVMVRDLLAPDGSVYVHLDQRTTHYVKVLMDRIFGASNFRNEIIWRYVSGGVARRHFPRKHDTILFYSRSEDYVFHPQKERKKSLRENTVPHGRDEKGEFVWYIRPGSNPSVPSGVKKYLDGFVSDVWDIPIVNPQARERRDAALFPTQKPLALLRRIIMASSDPGDLVLDPFCGSGTTAAAAAELGRRFACCDSSPHALNVSIRRLLSAGRTVLALLPERSLMRNALGVRLDTPGALARLRIVRLVPPVPPGMKQAAEKAAAALPERVFLRSLVSLAALGRTGKRGFIGTAVVPQEEEEDHPPQFDFPLPPSSAGEKPDCVLFDIFGNRHLVRPRPG